MMVAVAAILVAAVVVVVVIMAIMEMMWRDDYRFRILKQHLLL